MQHQNRKSSRLPVADKPPVDMAGKKLPTADRAARRDKNKRTKAVFRRASAAPGPSDSQIWPNSSQDSYQDSPEDNDMEEPEPSLHPNDDIPEVSLSEAEIAEDRALHEAINPETSNSGAGNPGSSPRASTHSQQLVVQSTTPTSTMNARATLPERRPNTPETVQRTHCRTGSPQPPNIDTSTNPGIGEGLHKRYAVDQKRFEDRWDVLKDIAKALDDKLAEHGSNPDIAGFALQAKDQVIKLLHTLANSVSPTPLQPGQRTYAEAAKPTTGGLSSSLRACQSDATPTQTPRTRAPMKGSSPQAQSRTDSRLFARLAEDNPMKAADPFAILNKLRSRLGHEANLIHTVQRTRTGFAIIPNRTINSAKSRLLQLRELIKNALGATNFEENTPWTTVILPTVPKSYSDGTSPQPITLELLRSEITRVSGSTPTYVNWTRSSIDNPTTGAVIVSFTQEQTPSDPFRLFCTGPLSRILPARKPKPTQCQTCYKWHSNPNLRCWSESRCRICGQSTHGDTPCSAIKCRNCRGPHPADDKQCPARPYLKNGQYICYTKAQLQAIRQETAATQKQKEREDNSESPLSTQANEENILSASPPTPTTEATDPTTTPA